MTDTNAIPMYTPFFGVMGATAAMVFSGRSSIVFSTNDRRYFSVATMLECHRCSPRSILSWPRSTLTVNVWLNCCISLLIDIFSFGSRLWYCKIWYWYRRHVCHEARINYEIHHSCSYGWYHCHLRSCSSRFNRQQKYPSSTFNHSI